MLRRNGTTLLYLLLLVIAITSVGLFVHNRSLNIERHYAITGLFERMLLADSQLDREVLQIRVLRARNPDQLMVSRRQLRKLEEALRETRIQDSTLSPAFNAALTSLDASLNKKLALTEQIKSSGATISSTLQYAPNRLLEIAHAQPPMLAQPMTLLSSQMLFQYLVNDPNQFQDIEQTIAELEQRGYLARTPDDAEEIHALVKKVALALVSMREIESELDEYFQLSLRNPIEAARRIYLDSYARETHRAELMMLLLVLTLVVVLAGLGLSVREVDNARRSAENTRTKLQDALESISDGFALFDAQDRLVLWNSNLGRLLPASHGKLEAGIRFRSLLRQLIESGQFRASSTYGRWYRKRLQAHRKGALASDVHLSDGRILAVRVYRTSERGTATLLTDVTEQRILEKHLSQLSQTVEQSPHAVVITDHEGRIEYINPKYSEMTGYQLEDLAGQLPAALAEQQDSEDSPWRNLREQREWRGELQDIRKSGERYIQSVTLSPLVDDQHRVSHYILLAEDISERRRAEEQLHLAAAVFDTTQEGILMTDADNRIIRINPAFTRITGYSASEVLGKNPSLFKSTYQDQAFFSDMWQRLEDENHWQGEIYNRKKNGEIYPSWLQIAVLRNDQGQVQNHVAVFRDITDSKNVQEQVRWQANYDDLTRLPNRTLFSDRLRQSISLAKDLDDRIALLRINLNRFKVINDTFGYREGDKLLREAAARLEALTGDINNLARLGGDEFACCILGLRDTGEAAQLARQAIEQLVKPYELLEGEAEAHVSVSVGIAVYPEDASNTVDLLRCANLALQGARLQGYNRHHFFTRKMNTAIRARNQLEGDLRKAIAEQQFVTWFQPVIDLHTGRVRSAEALVRWHHPSRGLIMPGQFIQLAEEIGLIGELGEQVLRDACHSARHWPRIDGKALSLSVNLSIEQLNQGFDQEHLQQILEQSGLDPARLTLELTESMVAKDQQQACARMQSLKDTGVRLSIDDFGTGYSSLSYLQQLPFDILKIDKSFTDVLDLEDGDESLVRAIIAIANSLGLDVIAEGVETLRQFDILQGEGCRLFQGYYFSKPLPENDFTSFAKHFMMPRKSVISRLQRR